jgi:hypothetical protein
MLDHIQHNLQRAQDRMKHQVDKNRQERTFQVGDWVYVKFQPYVQQSVQRRANHKLTGCNGLGPTTMTLRTRCEGGWVDSENNKLDSKFSFLCCLLEMAPLLGSPPRAYAGKPHLSG